MTKQGRPRTEEREHQVTRIPAAGTFLVVCRAEGGYARLYFDDVGQGELTCTNCAAILILKYGRAEEGV